MNPDDPVPLRDIFAAAMARIDGCPDCDNTEPPRAAIPLDNDWRCSYLCTDCGCTWLHDWKD